MTDVLRIENHGTVRVLTFNRPEKKNAFDIALADAFWEALDECSRDATVHAVVVTGVGNVFTAGADLDLFMSAAAGDTNIAKVARLHEPLRACTKPLIAAVQGAAVGMGVTMLPHFDLVYASEQASFLTPFVRLGLVVEYGGSWTLPELIGAQRAKELLLTAKPIDAATAEKWGLVARTFPAGDLLREALAVATAIAAQPPTAIADTLRLVEQASQLTLDEAIRQEDATLARRYGSAENVAAVQAFLARKR